MYIFGVMMALPTRTREHSNTRTLEHSNTLTLQHFNTLTLQYSNTNPLSPPPAPFLSGYNRFVRALLVGAGGMGKAWGRNLRDHGATTVAGWVDLRPNAAAAAAEEIGVQPEYVGTDLVHAIEALSPDFVVDVTAPSGHCEVTTTALGMGLPVIGEKPMATNLGEAKRMVKASEDAGKLYMVSQSRRYDGRLQAYRRLIEANLGALGILNSDFYIGAHFGGFRDEMEHVLLVDMAIHTFDAARYLSQSDPVSVYAEEFNPSWSWYQGDACATCLFEMTDGLRYTYRGSWCAEGSPSSWEGDWRAVGVNGTALWDGHGDPNGQIVVEPGGFHSKVEDISEESLPIRSGIAGSLDEFLDALEAESIPNGECHDNIKSFAMVCAAVESARRRQRVEIAELLNDSFATGVRASMG